MSKLDLQIDFDRDDRTYRGGDLVSGSVTVAARQDVTCNGLSLSYCWRTHGKGNRNEGPSDDYLLYEGAWRAGEAATYPFQFTARHGPPTYRGHHLNIDHYVRVRADIPWALDPKAEEEFVLLPGATASYEGIPDYAAESNAGLALRGTKYYLIGGGACLLLGLMCLFPLGFVLIPLALFLFWRALRNTLLEKRLGEVQLDLGDRQVSPGSRVPVRLQFTPRKAFRINGITAKVTGQETCTSGSGTNKTTYTHPLHDETYQIAAAREVQANSKSDFTFDLQIPDTDAYSFHASDNQIRWTVKVRIDIPAFPDWSQEVCLLVLPMAEPAPPAEMIARPDVAAPGAERAAAADTPRLSAATPVAGTGIGAAVPQPAAEASGPSLDEVCARIAETSRYGDDRKRIISGLRDVVFDCEMDFDRIERTVISDDQRFRNGRTITGRLAESGQLVSVLASDAKNDEIDRLAPGSRGRLRCALVEWDTLFDRPQLHYV